MQWLSESQTTGVGCKLRVGHGDSKAPPSPELVCARAVYAPPVVCQGGNGDVTSRAKKMGWVDCDGQRTNGASLGNSAGGVFWLDGGGFVWATLSRLETDDMGGGLSTGLTRAFGDEGSG